MQYAYIVFDRTIDDFMEVSSIHKSFTGALRAVMNLASCLEIRSLRVSQYYCNSDIIEFDIGEDFGLSILVQRYKLDE